MGSCFRIDDDDMNLLRLTDSFIHGEQTVWVDQGTLLGLVRDKKLIEWDNDIDLSCMYTNRPKLKLALIKKLLQQDYVALTSRYGVTIKKLRDDGNSKKVDLTYIYNHNGHMQKSYSDYVHQTFFAKLFEKTIKEALKLIEKSNNCTVRLCIWLFANPVSWFYRSFFMKTIDMECPDWQFSLEMKPLAEDLPGIGIYKSPEKYIRYKYGPDWHIAKRDWDYTSQDGGVIQKNS